MDAAYFEIKLPFPTATISFYMLICRAVVVCSMCLIYSWMCGALNTYMTIVGSQWFKAVVYQGDLKEADEESAKYFMTK